MNMFRVMILEKLYRLTNIGEYQNFDSAVSGLEMGETVFGGAGHDGRGAGGS